MASAYVTIQEADAFFQERLHETAWSQANAKDKSNSLIAATRIIDSLSFKGVKNAVQVLLDANEDATDEEIRVAEASQELEFPRGDDTVVPERIKWATFEIAHALLDGVDPELEFENMSIRDAGIGSVRASYNRAQEPLEYFMNGVPSATAWKYLKPFLRENESVKLVRVS